MNGHSRRATRQGRVKEYDAAAGYGVIAGREGEWHFHCTAIAGGSRSINADVEVTFSLTPGHHGRFEATDIRSV